MYNILVNLINCIERTYMMTKAKSGLKGKLKDKAAKVKKDIQEKD